jgi:hypothetical protein
MNKMKKWALEICDFLVAVAIAGTFLIALLDTIVGAIFLLVVAVALLYFRVTRNITCGEDCVCRPPTPEDQPE